MQRPAAGLNAVLATRPAGLPATTTAWPPLASAVPRSLNPTSALRVPRSRISCSADLPMKSSLSNFTAQARSASSGFDSASVSCPTMTCFFSSRSRRCASTPNGTTRHAGSQRGPAAVRASQTCSPHSAGTWISQPVSPTKPIRSSSASTLAMTACRQAMYGNASRDRSQSVSAPSTRRACGPARLSAASPPVTFVTCTSQPVPTVHQASHCSTASTLPEVVVRKKRSSAKRETVPSLMMIPASSHITP